MCKYNLLLISNVIQPFICGLCKFEYKFSLLDWLKNKDIE